jgi:hypothetical protein
VVCGERRPLSQKRLGYCWSTPFNVLAWIFHKLARY